jgi:cytochrome c biogenesis protein
MKSLLRKILKSLSSLRLTVVALVLMIIAVIPATLIIQNQAEEFYLSRYPALGGMILASGYDHFFSSLLFLILIGFFWINLFSCTLRRFLAQLRRRGPKRFGPDILHLGLLLLIMASLFSFASSREGSLFLRPGDGIRLPSGHYMILKEFIYQQYPDGRPKSWISRVVVTDSPDGEGEMHEIAVNHPLRIDGLVVYQTGYRPSVRVGEYEPGLTIASDPGRPYILVSFLLITTGLMVTLIQKRRKT